MIGATPTAFFTCGGCCLLQFSISSSSANASVAALDARSAENLTRSLEFLAEQLHSTADAIDLHVCAGIEAVWLG